VIDDNLDGLEIGGRQATIQPQVDADLLTAGPVGVREAAVEEVA